MYTPWKCWKNPKACIELFLPVPVQRGRKRYRKIFAKAWLQRARKRSVEVIGRCHPETILPIFPFCRRFSKWHTELSRLKKPSRKHLKKSALYCLSVSLLSLRVQGALARHLHVSEQLCVTWWRSVAQSCNAHAQSKARNWKNGLAEQVFLQSVSPQIKVHPHHCLDLTCCSLLPKWEPPSSGV